MSFAPAHAILETRNSIPRCAPSHSANVRTRDQTLLFVWLSRYATRFELFLTLLGP
jgi:hypothetical protein